MPLVVRVSIVKHFQRHSNRNIFTVEYNRRILYSGPTEVEGMVEGFFDQIIRIYVEPHESITVGSGYWSQFDWFSSIYRSSKIPSIEVYHLYISVPVLLRACVSRCEELEEESSDHAVSYRRHYFCLTCINAGIRISYWLYSCINLILFA